MHYKTTLIWAGLIGIAQAGFAHATDIHTRTIASTCMSCHGPGGRSQGSIPDLAGLDQGFFVKVMKEFKAGTRSATVMKRHAAGFTDAEFESMGAYFSKLK